MDSGSGVLPIDTASVVKKSVLRTFVIIIMKIETQYTDIGSGPGQSYPDPKPESKMKGCDSVRLDLLYFKMGLKGQKTQNSINTACRLGKRLFLIKQ